MNRNNQELIREAAEALKLRDIFLFQCHMERPTPFPEEPNAEVEQLGRRAVQMIRDDVESPDKSKPSLIQFYVLLGLRLAAPGQDNEEDEAGAKSSIFLEIEAEYLVEYEVTNSEVSQDALKAFAEFNVVHNVWPFWRQHIFDLRQRGGLPKIEVPLFAGTEL